MFNDCRTEEDYYKLEIKDLRYVVTLGIGGFGRVELVHLKQNSSKAFALKQMKKREVSSSIIVRHHGTVFDFISLFG